MSDAPPREITTEQAAFQLRVSTDAVRRYWRSGILRGRRHGNFVLIEQRAVIALMKFRDQARTGVKPTPPTRRASPTPFEDPDDGDRCPLDSLPLPRKDPGPVAGHDDAGGDPPGR